MDSPTALGIAAAAVLCAFAAFLAYGSGGVPDHVPQEDGITKDGEALLAMVEMADAYRDGGQDAAAEEQEEAFQQKLAEVARNRLGVEISSANAYLFFPDLPDPAMRPGQICGSAAGIPAHLEKVRGAGWFMAYMEKYSSYTIQMHLNDERPELGFHYGFTAASGDGGHATTYFHVDTCTGEVIDPDSYRLTCRDGGSDYVLSTSNYDDTVASLELEEFCDIPLDPWRQDLYDYSVEESEAAWDLLAEDPEDYESFMAREREFDQLNLLSELARMAYSNNFEDAEIQERMLEYCGRFGPLPEDLADLMEGGGPGRSLSAC